MAGIDRRGEDFFSERGNYEKESWAYITTCEVRKTTNLRIRKFVMIRTSYVV